MNIIKTSQHYVGTVCNTDETIKGLAEIMGSEVSSWGSVTSARLATLKNFIGVGVQQIIQANSGRDTLTERLVVVSCTTKQEFDGIYRLNGEKVQEMDRYAFFGTSYHGDVPKRFIKS